MVHTFVQRTKHKHLAEKNFVIISKEVVDRIASQIWIELDALSDNLIAIAQDKLNVGVIKEPSVPHSLGDVV